MSDDRDILAMQKQHGTFEDSAFAKIIPEFHARPETWSAGSRWRAVAGAAIFLAESHGNREARVVYNKAVLACKREGVCHLHAHLPPTTAETYGHVLYADDACGWCEELK